MSRFTARRRWLMTGPWPHPRTGILYYRKVTPPDLFAEKGRLAEFGIKVTREIQRSLETKDRRAAERAYSKICTKVEAEWDRWRSILRDGPQALSPKQQVAVAADYAKEFLATYDEDPFTAPSRAEVLNLSEGGDAEWGTMAGQMGSVERKAFLDDLNAFLHERDERRQPRLIFGLISRYPDFARVVGADFAAVLEASYGSDTRAALANKSLCVDRGTRNLVNMEMARLMGAAQRGLEARRVGDYSPVRELEVAPKFVPLSSSHPAMIASDVLTLEFLLDHKAKTHNSRIKTVSDNRSYIRKFAEFVGHNDARRVVKEDVRRWRDSLMATGLSPKTITSKYLSALGAVLSHGVKEFDLPSNSASGILDNRPGAAPTRSKGWTAEEAVQILKATFGGSSKALSQPHKRAIFWIPWIVAYTGLRATEAAQLQAEHLREEGGIPFLLITPVGGSTKSGKAWTVGIHEHLVELGLLDFIRSMREGPMFYEPYPAGVDPMKLKGKLRSSEAAERVASWIKDEVGLEPPLGRPLHAFRHLFTTLGRKVGMNERARNHMLGSGPVDARESYGDWTPDVLEAEIKKLPRFDVVDTGWRPWR